MPQEFALDGISMKGDTSIEALLKDIAALSVNAGQAILDIYTREDFGVTYKQQDANQPLTLADKAANDVIEVGLSNLEPHTPILSEESKSVPFSQRASWGRFWLVDPLDGTKEFIKRNGEFTVNIALIQDGKAVLGVVHAPVLGVTYFGASGLGAFKTKDGNTEPIGVADYSKSDVVKIVGSRSHGGPELEGFIKRLGDGGVKTEFVSMGSSLKLCLVAQGAAHLYPRFGPTMEWDTGAAQAVVEAAGGSVVGIGGAPLLYNKEDLLNPYFVVAGKPAFPWQKYMGKE